MEEDRKGKVGDAKNKEAKKNRKTKRGEEKT